VPAYNEEKRIGKMLEAYGSFFSDKEGQGVENELLIVLNNCSDNTLGVVLRYMEKYNNINYLNLVKGGKGYAIMEGFKECLNKESRYIGFVDADLSTSPGDFYDLYKNLKEDDGTIASRWLRESNAKRSFGKYMRSKSFNILVNSLFLMNYKDTQCGAKLFKRETLEKIVNEITSIEWAFDVDLLYLANKKGYKIKEIPTTWVDSEGSKISPKVPIQMGFGVIRLRLIHSPFKLLVKAYDLLPDKIKIHKTK